MPKVRVALVREGMVVTADVKNMDNMLLIPAGCVLSEKHVNIFNAWGITEVQIESGGEAEGACDTPQQVSDEVLQEIRHELMGLYWDYNDKCPVQTEIFDLALRRKANHRIESLPR